MKNNEENEHLRGYLNLNTHEHFTEDLAGLLDTAHDALFSQCHMTRNGAIDALRECFDDYFKPTALHHADGHILMDFHVSYGDLGHMPAYLGEIKATHRHNIGYRSIILY